MADPAESDDDVYVNQVMQHHDSLETRYERLRQAYANLMEHHQELDERIRSMHDIHIVTDAVGVILQTNQAASLISSTHRLVGTLLGDWVRASHREEFTRLLECAVRDGADTLEKWELHLRRDAPYSPTLVASAQMIAVVDEGAVSVVHWILRPANAALEQMSEPRRPMVEFERDSQCSFVTDAAGTILEVNTAFTRSTGFSAEDAVGKNPRIFASGLQDAVFYKDFWTELQSSGSWQGLMLNRRKNGQIFPLWMKVSAGRDEAGRITTYLSIFYDLARATSTGIQAVSRQSPPNVYRTEPPPDTAA